MTSSSVPLWVALVIAVGSPLLTFGGVLLTIALNRSTARQADTRWQREETMRLLRWATELSADPGEQRRALGIVALRSLVSAPLLQEADATLVRGIMGEALRGIGEETTIEATEEGA